MKFSTDEPDNGATSRAPSVQLESGTKHVPTQPLPALHGAAPASAPPAADCVLTLDGRVYDQATQHFVNTCWVFCTETAQTATAWLRTLRRARRQAANADVFPPYQLKTSHMHSGVLVTHEQGWHALSFPWLQALEAHHHRLLQKEEDDDDKEEELEALAATVIESGMCPNGVSGSVFASASYDQQCSLLADFAVLGALQAGNLEAAERCLELLAKLRSLPSQTELEWYASEVGGLKQSVSRASEQATRLEQDLEQDGNGGTGTATGTGTGTGTTASTTATTITTSSTAQASPGVASINKENRTPPGPSFSGGIRGSAGGRRR